MPIHRICVALLSGITFSMPIAAQDAIDAIRYGRDVRPILADRCFRCHGPDAQSRAADLRLDDRELATAAREHGAAIVPGDAERSLLWQRVRAHDDDRMPPADSGKQPLSAAELNTVQAWIQAGAHYEPHWSFVPPQRPSVPTGGAAHPIDRFLAQRQQHAGLTPNPPADRATLGRRAFLVVTGLPPTPAELEAFVADNRADAFARLIDHLLDDEPYRTRHAEHLAQPWLDAARYADTSGIHMDAGRQAWKWRDWLLDALRDDLPFDRFVVEQLAGDLLPDATPEQRVATGFLRNHVTTDEGGAIDEEYRIEYAAERTATVGSVFLGLTLGCARCHDHKYDPIRQDDYYQLFAFFNSNREPGLYSQVPDSNRALEPFLEVPNAAQASQRAALHEQLKAAELAVQEGSSEEAAAFAAFTTAELQPFADAWQWLPPTGATSRNGATMAIAADAAVNVSGANPDRDDHELTFVIPPGAQRWLCLQALTSPDLPEGKVGRAPNGNVVLQYLRLQARPAGREAPWRTVPFAYAIADTEQEDADFAVTNLFADDKRGWAMAAHLQPARPMHAALLAAEPFGSDEPTELRVLLRYDSQYSQHVFGRVRIGVADAHPAMLAKLPLATDGFHVAGPFEAPRAKLYAKSFGPELATELAADQRWGEVAWRFDSRLRLQRANTELPDGSNATYVAHTVHSPTARRVRAQLGSDDGFQLFVNGQLAGQREVDRGVALDQDPVEIDLRAGANLVVLKVVNTGGAGGFALRYESGAAEWAADLRLLALPEPLGAAGHASRIGRAYRELRSPHHQARLAAVTATQKQLRELEASIPRAMVMQEAESPRPTFVLTRGDYDKPDPKRPVQRDIPAVFGTLPADAPKNRLGLARWLVSEQNPLLLRVAVNRLWEFVFGAGLVRTSEDFGLQGEWPSHPELLDWLAVEYRARGLSTRAMLRLLLTSAAFQQQNTVQTDAAARDRDNRLVWRFNRRRLPAEALRDQALYLGNLLVERQGGPSVKPMQPAGLWQEVAMTQSNTRVYEPGSGEDLWRRSLYTYWKRACPPPSLLMLDAPTREFCTIRRTTTNTPLQALVLWNDEQFLTAARGLAIRVCKEPGDDAARIRAMHHLCTGRMPTPANLQRTLAALSQWRTRYAEMPADASDLLGATQLPADQTAKELAPFVLLASVCLNLDSTLCID